MVGDCQIKANVFIGSFLWVKALKCSKFPNQEQQCSLFIHGGCICVSMDQLTFIVVIFYQSAHLFYLSFISLLTIPGSSSFLGVQCYYQNTIMSKSNESTLKL